ncbi:S-protein homolog 29-like [Lotus japonicus]|uniref:S-protein homolog n=1 Tax=Lotus japonicus TaxID=34305 RepID=I3T4U2_LOTJA|nr:S-protein homolog 29-like [Lotus japonicus]AFK47534.1 unknown [Lotus japonicus]
MRAFTNILKVLVIVFWLVSITTDKFIEPVQGQHGDGFLGKKTVRVQNDLGNGVTLFVQCRSKDDDLGPHYLSNGQYQEWSFINSVFGVTLFWCNIGWNDVKKSFIVYNVDRDGHVCGSRCWRSIKSDGAYFYHQYERGQWVMEIKW